MKLEEYLSNAEKALDSNIQVGDEIHTLAKEQFGIYNNYRILLNGNFDSIKKIFDHSGNFAYRGASFSSRNSYFYNYVPGIIVMQLSDRPCYDETEENHEKVNSSFGSTITLHIQNEKNMGDVTYEDATWLYNKAAGTAIMRSLVDICDILKKNRIAFLLPDSSRIYSKMIHYP